MTLVPAGLLADYRLDEGSGTTVHDSSPNAYHSTGANGTFPAWSAAGLTFNATGRVLVPVPPASVRTVQAFFTTSSNDPGSTRWIVGNETSTSVAWDVATTGWPSGAPLLGPQVYNDTNTLHFVVPGSPALATWLHNAPDPNTIYLGRDPVVMQSAGTTSPATFAGQLTLGGSAFGGSLGFLGTIHRVAFYDRVLADAEIRANVDAMASDGLARGVTLAAPNPAAERPLLCEGDSITAGTLVATPWPASLVLAATAPTYHVYNAARSGQALATMLASGYQRLSPLFVADWAKNCTVIFGGTNDFAAAGQTPATIFANLQSLVNLYRQKCGLVVVVPMLSRDGIDGLKNSYNALMAAAWGAGQVPGVALVPAASLPHLVPDGSSANTTWCLDGTHPTQAGTDEIAAAVGPVINGATFVAPVAPAAPTFTPAAGLHAGALAVTITPAYPGEALRYTADGTTPTAAAGTPYAGPVAVAAPATLRAIGYGGGYADSLVGSAAYAFPACRRAGLDGGMATLGGGF